MSKIILDVNSSNEKTLLTILNNLKSGLIQNIQVVEQNSTNTLSKESSTSTSKYLSAAEFKSRLKKK